MSYVYTGNPFTSNLAFSGSPSAGYTSVTESITVAAALAPSTVYTSTSIIESYSFSVHTFTNLNSMFNTTTVSFGFETNASGDIAGVWAFDFDTSLGSAGPGLYTINGAPPLDFDYGTSNIGLGSGAVGGVNGPDDAGTWKIESAVTPSGNGSAPEPVTLTIFGAGFAGVAAMRRRKTKRS